MGVISSKNGEEAAAVRRASTNCSLLDLLVGDTEASEQNSRNLYHAEKVGQGEVLEARKKIHKSPSLSCAKSVIGSLTYTSGGLFHEYQSIHTYLQCSTTSLLQVHVVAQSLVLQAFPAFLLQNYIYYRKNISTFTEKA